MTEKAKEMLAKKKEMQDKQQEMNNQLKIYLKEAVAYLRYSTHNQDDGISIESQTKDINDYAKKHGYVITKWYIDRATSARKAAGRDNFIQLFKDVESGNTPPNLFVFATNRAFRNAYESHKYRAILRENGVKLISATQNFNEETSSGRLTANIMADIDQYKAEEISEFVSAATRLLISEGLFAGGKPPFGFTTQPVMYNGKERVKLVPYEPEASVVRDVFDGVIAGKTLSQIAAELNEQGLVTRNGNPFHREAVRYMIENIVYKGERHYKLKNGDDAYSSNYCTPIVSKETFALANKVHAENKSKTKPKKKKRIYSLTGLMVCGDCGKAVVGNGSRGYYYYGCHTKYKHRKCSTRQIRKEQLEEMTFDAIKENILSDKAIDDITSKVLSQIKKPSTTTEDKKTLLATKAALESELAESIRLRTKNIISDEALAASANSIEAELSAINKKLDKLKMSFDSSIDAEFIKKRIHSIFYREASFTDCNDVLLQELFRKTVKSIEITSTQVVIHLRILIFDIKDKRGYGFPELSLSLKFERKQKPKA